MKQSEAEGKDFSSAAARCVQVSVSEVSELLPVCLSAVVFSAVPVTALNSPSSHDALLSLPQQMGRHENI